MTDEPPDPDRLILEFATGSRPVTESELANILEHVAHAGFDPTPNAMAGGRLAGLTWQGRVLRGRDRLSSAEVHYLRHVAVRGEWPTGTSLEQYLHSARTVIGDPATGVLVSRYDKVYWQLTAVRLSGDLKGPQGYDWVAVEYRLETGYWVTAYQPEGGLAGITGNPRRQEQQWLRSPQALDESMSG